MFISDLCDVFVQYNLQSSIVEVTTIKLPSNRISRCQLLGFRSALLKRLLLQTPLIFWPAILTPDITISDEVRAMLQTPEPVLETAEVEPKLYIDVKNKQSDAGYDVFLLWKKLLQTQEISFAPLDIEKGRTCRFSFSL